MSLLTKAKAHKTNSRNRKFSKEEVELCEAWLTDEISLTGVMKALETSSGQAYVFLATCARQILQEMGDK